MEKETIKTLINCSEDCCGCLNGKKNITGAVIDFKCNECGRKAGYIVIEEFKKLIE